MNTFNKRKRLISMFLLIFIFIANMPVEVLANELKIKEDFIYEDDASTILKEYVGEDLYIKIPKNTKVIKKAAFKNKNINSLILNNELEVIEEEAFVTNKIKTLRINKNLKEIKDYAFANNQIEDISYDKTNVGSYQLNKIGKYAFQDNLLKNLDLSFYKGEVLEKGVFKGNILENVKISENIKEIKEETFMDNLIEKIDIENTRTIDDTSFIGGDGYTIVRIKEENKEGKENIKSSYVKDMYGHIVNPVNIKVISLDEEANKILPDRDIEFDRRSSSHFFALNEKSFYIPEEVNGYKKVKDVYEFTPDKDWYTVKVEYKRVPGPTLEQVNFLRNKREGDDVNEEELLYLVEALNSEGEDISDKLIVEPKRIENASEGIHEIIYAVEDEGVIATERVNIFIGEDPFKIEVGNTGWVLGDFTYYHEGINEDGSEELSKEHIGSIESSRPLRRHNGKKHQYVTGFSNQGLKKFNDGLKTLALPHLNPYTLQNITAVDGYSYSKLSFSDKRYSGTLHDHESLEYIGNKSFYDASFQGQFPNMPNLRRIENEAFSLNAYYYPTEVFTGNFPVLPNLEHIGFKAFSSSVTAGGIRGSKFNGEFPKLDNLKYIGNYAFDGAIFRGRFPEMRKLEVVGNSAFGWAHQGNTVFSGTFPELPKLRFVGQYAFHLSKFEGELPLLESLETVREHAFHASKFTGELPKLNKLKKAEENSFSNSIFTGEFPYLESLEVLGGVYDTAHYGVEGVFQRSNFTGEFPALPKLEYIGVRTFENSKFTGDFPSLDNLVEIREKAFRGAKFDGTLNVNEKLKYIGNEAFMTSPFKGELKAQPLVWFIGRRAFRDALFTGEFPQFPRLNYLRGETFYSSRFTGDFKTQKNLIEIGEEIFYNSNFTGDFKTQPRLTVIGDKSFYKSKFQGRFEPQPEVEKIGSFWGYTFPNAEFTGEFPLLPKVEEIERESFMNSKFTGEFPKHPKLRIVGAKAFQKSSFTGEFPNISSIYRLGNFSFYSSKFTGEFPAIYNLGDLGEGSFYHSEFEGKFPEFGLAIENKRDLTLGGASYRAVPAFYHSNFDKEVVIGNKTTIRPDFFGNIYGNTFNVRTKNLKAKGDIVNDTISTTYHEQNPVYGDIIMKDKITGRTLMDRRNVTFRHTSEDSMYYYAPMLVGYDLPLTKYGSGDIFSSVRYNFPIEGSIYDKQEINYELDVVDKDVNNDYNIKMKIFNEEPITHAGQRVNGRFTFTYPDVNPLDGKSDAMFNGFLGITADKNVFSSLEVDLEKPLHRRYSNSFGYMLTFRPDLNPGEEYEVNFSLVVGKNFKSGMVSDSVIMSFYPNSNTGIIKSKRFNYNIDSMPQLLNTRLMNSMSNVNILGKGPIEIIDGKKYYTPRGRFTIDPEVGADDYLAEKYNIDISKLENARLEYSLSNYNLDDVQLNQDNGWKKVGSSKFVYDIKDPTQKIPSLDLSVLLKRTSVGSYDEGGHNSQTISISGTLTGDYEDLKISDRSNGNLYLNAIPVKKEVFDKENELLDKKLERMNRSVQRMSFVNINPSPLIETFSNTLVGYFGVEMYSGYINEDGEEYISDIHRIRREPGEEFFRDIIVRNTMSTDRKDVEVLVPFATNGDFLNSNTKEFLNLDKKVESFGDTKVLYLNTDEDIREIYKNGKGNILKTANEIFKDSWSDEARENTKAVKLIFPNVKSRSNEKVRIHMIANPSDTNKDWFRSLEAMAIYTHKDSNRESNSSINHLFIEKKELNEVEIVYKVVDQHGNPVKGSRFDLYSDVETKEPGVDINFKVNNQPYTTNSKGELRLKLASNYSYKIKPVNSLRPQYYHPIEEEEFIVLRDEIYPLENESVYKYEPDILQRRHEEYPVFFKNLEVYNDLSKINQYLLKNEEGKQLKTGRFQLINRDTNKVVDGFEDFVLGDDNYNEHILRYGKYELKQLEEPHDNDMPYNFNKNSYYFELGKYGDLKGGKDSRYDLPGRFIYFPNKIEEQKSDVNVFVRDFLTKEIAEGEKIKLESLENTKNNQEQIVDSEGYVHFKEVPGGVYQILHIGKDGSVKKHDTIPLVVSKFKSEVIDLEMLVNVVKLRVNLNKTIKKALSYDDAKNYSELLNMKDENKKDDSSKYIYRASYNGLYDVVKAYEDITIDINNKAFKTDKEGSLVDLQYEFIEEIKNKNDLTIKAQDFDNFYSEKKVIKLDEIMDLDGFDNNIVVDIELNEVEPQLTLSYYNIEDNKNFVKSKNILNEKFDEDYEYSFKDFDKNYRKVYQSNDDSNVNAIYYKSSDNLNNKTIDVEMKALKKNIAQPVEELIKVEHLKDNSFKAKAIHLLDKDANISLKLENIDGDNKEKLKGGVFNIYKDEELIMENIEVEEDFIDIDNIQQDGVLRITQMKAPKGYRINSKTLIVKLEDVEDGDILTFLNYKQGIIPDTGGYRRLPFYILSSILLSLAFLNNLRNRREYI